MNHRPASTSCPASRLVARRSTAARLGRFPSAGLAVCFALAWFSTACNGTLQTPREKQLLAERDEARQVARRLTDRVNELTQQLDALQQQVSTLQQIQGKRIDLFASIDHIQFGRHTGPVNTDGKPGHDSVMVYLECVDADSATLKAPGAVTLQLFDLAADSAKLVEQSWTPDELRAHWKSGFLTYHYSFEIPLPAGLASRDLTLRAAFTDYITGEIHTAQKPLTVDLPPAN